MGLERVLAILTEQDNLRDVVLFPLMKAEAKQKSLEICDVNMEDIQALYGVLPAIKDVEGLAGKYLKETYRHCQDVARVMNISRRNLIKAKIYDILQAFFTISIEIISAKMQVNISETNSKRLSAK